MPTPPAPLLRPLLPFGVALLVLGCASGMGPPRQPDAGGDTGPGDAGVDTGVDAGEDAGMDAGMDAGEPDAGTDAGEPDAGMDAGEPDAGVDAGEPDAGPMVDAGPCGASEVAPVATVPLDGVDDIAAYPTAQVLTPGAVVQTWERFGLAWDADYLYVTYVAERFEDAFVPMHVYLEVNPTASASPGTGKEYSGLTPQLPFSPEWLIAARRGSGGADDYSGLYPSTGGFGTRTLAFEAGVSKWVASDNHTLSVRIPLVDLGCPRVVRLAAHVVNGAAGNEWKDTVPSTHTPWTSAATGYYVVDLSSDSGVATWSPL